jgi:hypothetical protein
MPDVQETEPPVSKETGTPRRRRPPRVAPGAPTTTQRRQGRGIDLIESLRESVEQLIRENQTLKRQLAKATAGGGASAAPAAERTLRSIQRKVLRAVGDEGSSRRRPRAASPTRTSSATNGRRRRRT